MSEGAGADPLHLNGYVFGNDYTSGKKQSIQSRLAADFTKVVWVFNTTRAIGGTE